MLVRINFLLGGALVLVFALLLMVQVDHSKPNYQVNLGDDMTYSPAYGAFEPNSNFPNGRTMQESVPGTIARGTQIFHFEPTPQDAIRAGEELSNPFDLNTEEGIASADRGAVAFQTFCVACHGGDGTGNGPVAQRGFPPPPSLLIGKSKDMKEGQIFHLLTYGQNSMPQFAAQLSPNSRWDVVSHLRRLQRAESKKAKLLPKTDPISQPDTSTPASIETEPKP